MKIVIIEDERITASDLAATIIELEPTATIVATLYSVKTAIEYFRKNEFPDLIFSDVQLGDGLSFEIFEAVKVGAPLIFCTAYDEYALNAFKANGIDYVLKPFTSDSIAESLAKYRTLENKFASKNNDLQYKTIIESLLQKAQPKPSAILVHHKDKITPIRVDDIALFYIENEITYLVTFDKKSFSINKKLDELEQQCGSDFFRVSRQCLLSRDAVIDASHFFSRKLSVNICVPLDEKITVSKEKSPQFLAWLETTPKKRI